MITVWQADLDAPANAADASPRGTPVDPTAMLSDEERERAGRLRGAVLRRRWIAAHVALRQVLAAELDVPAHSLEFERDAHGKPRLAGAQAGALEFSLSHSAALAVIAVSRTAPVGVDVELVESITDSDAIARRHFAGEEWHALDRLAGDARVDAFYRIWTRKEAYLKATGMGLRHALDRFSVNHVREDARLLHIDGDAAAVASWTLVNLQLDRPYVGALATPVPGAQVRLMRCSMLVPGRRLS